MKLKILVSVISIVNGLLLVTVLTVGHSVSRESTQRKDRVYMIIYHCILYEVQMYLECQSQTQSPYLEYVLNCNYNFLLDVYMGWYVWVSRCEYVLGIELRMLGLTGSDFAC